MDIFNKFSKKSKTAAKSAKQRLAKTVKEETIEFAKSASKQMTGGEDRNINDQNQVSPIVEAMQQGTRSVSDAQHADIHHEEKRKLDYLQKELDELRRKKKLAEEQRKLMEERSQQQQKPLPPLVQPASKPKRGGGRFGFLQRKQKKTETGRMKG